MELLLRLAEKQYSVNLEGGRPISIPMHFNGEQPNTYGVDPAGAQAYHAGEFIGDVRKGGSCNFESYTLIPHCNGTHTECIGHITAKRISVHESVTDSLIPATVVSILPERAEHLVETYQPAPDRNDFVITGRALEIALYDADADFFSAMVIRTLPNDPQKCAMDYHKNPPPYFTNAAVRFLRAMGVRHLLVDIPSIDRLYDQGRLTNHRIYWNMTVGALGPNPGSDMGSSITEMIYVPDDIEDGKYLLNLQFPSFVADAAPSKPVLYPISLEE